MKESDAVMHYSSVYAANLDTLARKSHCLADVVYSSSLVQHATMVADGESPALESSRQALRLHINAWKTYKHIPDFIWSGHCHW